MNAQSDFERLFILAEMEALVWSFARRRGSGGENNQQQFDVG